MVANMTLDEKLVMLHGPIDGDCCQCNYSSACAYVGNVPGNTRLDTPPITMNDGPQGFRGFVAHSSTAFPGGMAVAATWDPAAVYLWGSSMGQEFYDKGANVQLGPGLNVARVPLNGRNFEYLSGEDPYLGAQLAGQAVAGIQSKKVVATAKHWALNNQETNRQNVSSMVDERTRFEMYYPPFEAAVEAGAGSFMCSYNKIQAVWSCENPETLQTDLKDRLGFKGYVMSDWGATHTPSINAGLDMEMPNGFFLNPKLLTLGLDAGIISQEKIDDSLMRIFTPMFAVGVMDEPVSAWDWHKQWNNVTTAESIEAARSISAQGTVLLKNEGGLLPLHSSSSLALIGFASDGAITHGDGSGTVTPSRLVTPLQGVQEALTNDGSVVFEDGTDLDAAVAAARAADVAVVFVGTISSEGYDRASLSLDDGCDPSNFFEDGKQCVGNNHKQNDMVQAIVKANPRTVVVLSVPGAVVMPWANQVPAILTNFMPGQEVGHAIADVLFGKVNPTGRLPITFPNHEDEIDFTPGQYPGLGLEGIPEKVWPDFSYYTEKLLVGYRYYDAKGIQFSTGFPFGHGLSYTNFSYSKLRVRFGSVSLTVTNTGAVAGADIPQLYLNFPEKYGEPLWQLKGFKKTQVLQPGQHENVHFRLTKRDLSVWDVKHHAWTKAEGKFGVKVGASSRDIRLEGRMDVIGEGPEDRVVFA